MKLPLLICALALTLAVAGCGGGDATGSQPQDSTSVSEGKPKGSLTTPPSRVVIGDYEPEGPFAGVSGRKGNRKPDFEPSGQPAPNKTISRELEVGSGPSAKRGDEISIYYVGADHETGDIPYYGWPPYKPASFRLGFSTFGKSWEKTIEGMKVGGIREVIITAPYLSKTALDYVIVLKALRPEAEKS